MLDRELIEKKLRRIEKFLREISPVEVNTFDEFDRNIMVRRFIERGTLNLPLNRCLIIQ